MLLSFLLFCSFLFLPWCLFYLLYHLERQLVKCLLGERCHFLWALLSFDLFTHLLQVWQVFRTFERVLMLIWLLALFTLFGLKSIYFAFLSTVVTCAPCHPFFTLFHVLLHSKNHLLQILKAPITWAWSFFIFFKEFRRNWCQFSWLTNQIWSLLLTKLVIKINELLNIWLLGLIFLAKVLVQHALGRWLICLQVWRRRQIFKCRGGVLLLLHEVLLTRQVKAGVGRLLVAAALWSESWHRLKALVALEI